MQNSNHIPSYKLKTVSFFIYCSFAILFARLIHLQVTLGPSFTNKSKKNFSRTESIESPRGNIVDRNGNLLATNRPVYNIYWQGSGNYRLSDDQQNTIEAISTILGKTPRPSFIQTITRAERMQKQVLFTSDITFEQLSQIEEKFSSKNIISKTSFKRHYPYKNYASHIVGYLGRINFDVVGKMGLENIFEHELKGKRGELATTINSFGRKLEKKIVMPAQEGTTIQTTLDIELQTIVETVFPKDQTGAFLLMDSQDGSILAITSRPEFDPNIFLNPISQETWDDMQQEKPFLNRAFYAQYPPGSIFKLVVTSAALEREIITPETIWDCKGYITFKGRRYHCHEQGGHGELTVSQALEQSCNPFFYDIGTKISIDTLSDYAHAFGLGEKTGIILPEQSGLIPNRQWKQDVKGEPWWPGETLSATVGQSFLLTTPLQIARMISSIFTGHLVKPRILMDEPIITTASSLQQETREFLQECMKKVVTQGTGKKINVIKDIEVYAKTSTAQTSSLSKRKQGKQYKEHGWFVAHFTYKENRPLILVVLVEHAGTSKIPVNIAKRFLINYKKLYDKHSSAA